MRALYDNNLDNNSNANGNNNLNNNGRFLRITPVSMASSLFEKFCSYDNLKLAFAKARKHKTRRKEVIEFEANLIQNLQDLRTELCLLSYCSQPLKSFILRDPKTRKISKSAFRDRVVHHALVNIIEPLFDKCFIYDSYANRKGRGTLKAIERFEFFSRKVSGNYTKTAYVLKADIRHYFETVDHTVLTKLLKNKIEDDKIMFLITKILRNYMTKEKNKGMPLGNLTSQFFANVYLNELDQFVKHVLKAKYYIRYVDDFVIVHNSFDVLNNFKQKINDFLAEQLTLELHSDKSKILPIRNGVEFLGLRVFAHYRLLKLRNLKKFQRKLIHLKGLYRQKQINYDSAFDFMEGWLAYARQANTYTLRKKFVKQFEAAFPNEISTKELNKYK